MKKFGLSVVNKSKKMAFAITTSFIAGRAMAIDAFDVTADQSNGKTASDVMDSTYQLVGQGTTLALGIATLVGFVVVAISAWSLYQASKDDSRETPKSGIVGLFMGGLLAGVSSVAWIMRNSLIGG